MPTTPKKRQSVKGARTRRLIKDAFIVLYGRLSWAEITLDEILKATGLTVGAFYFHFSSKDELIEEIAVETCKGYHTVIIDEINWDCDFFEIAHQIIHHYYQSYIRNPVLSRLMYSVVFRRSTAHAVWLESRKPLREKIEQSIHGALSDHSAQTPVDVAFTSHLLLSSLEDFLFAVFMSKGNTELSSLASGPDFFIRQQAIIWYRSALGKDPTHKLAGRTPNRKNA
ncbi:TetR/AcrR family transcriptional regulator [Exilibacterium tricleocarpae]|uniref:TetR/AcrR family transcriptional regulator n=1 Tax=Exilibacterium tricleocarpae TaxID=2591008 RepID=A0A545U9L8_9GAMM|nr:TetR/AcrR family transcriptional regulator [Exilibacterium tricleocarpae]TQV86129.1 TetR/AcrR family transcriptional regulator [Exilibacterium tricleocarpae]